MTLKIFNSLTRSKQAFESIEPGKVKMYVCGPTVYDYIHIGNSRPVIFFDVVRRYLEFSGYEVEYVTNFTDIDDKLIRKSNQLNIPVSELADKYIEAFLEDAEALRTKKGVNPRVTENMEEIIAFIVGLLDKGIAYESGGDVYFRTRQYPKYGQISHKNMDELQHGIRVEVDERKEHPQDFVLWKAAKPGEVSWASPWGEGRPGWHIECSALAAKYLGETMDIHGGGQDLEFPHHECEAAQSDALHGKPLANYWMHNGYLNINNEKMSKSLGNGLSVKEILKKASPEAVRYVILSTHYRNPLNFNDDSLHQAETGISRLNNGYSNLQHRLKSLEKAVSINPAVGEEPALEDADLQTIAAANKVLQDFSKWMDEDFNTADAITAMFDLAAAANRYTQNDKVAAEPLRVLIQTYEQLDSVLGLLNQEETGLVDEEIDRLMEERQEARRTKNWGRADEIRDLLTDRGIILEDTPQGIRWRRK